MAKKGSAAFSITIHSNTLSLAVPRIMGILNLTPDSFSDGGRFNSPPSALHRIEEMLDEGAHIIDAGGESTRPGSDPVSEEEELKRTIPVLKEAVKKFPDTLFSIDTTKYEVAKQALDCGVQIVNDVSGLQKEPRLAELCAEYGAAYILMHSQGDPKTMQKNPEYTDAVSDIFSFLKKGIKQLNTAGADHVIIDPGIGFGKKLEHNLQIIADLPQFAKLNCPILIGASRKSMIGSILDGRPADDRLAGTLAVHYHCLMHGAHILRVHDVKEAADTIKIFNAVKSQEKE